MGQNNDERPANIILIYVDDMGIGDASYTDGKVMPTPNIDKLAENGKVFTQYYTPAPVCSPSRVNVLTGTYHIRWGINTFLSSKKFNRKTEQQDYLDGAAPSMAKIMKAAGYRTAHYGKWHMGGGRDVKDAPQITAYGFDEYSSTWESPNADPLLTSSNWIWAPTDSIKRWERTAYFVDKTIKFIKESNESCFVNLWPDDVHSPWVASEQSQQEDKPKYYTLPNLKPVVAAFDREMGRLYDALDSIGELENTLIIFTSDNGPAPSFNRLRTNGLRGVKNSLYEGGVNMPMIAHWPAKIKAGQKDTTSILASIDLLPSLATIVGVNIEEKSTCDGKDFSKALLGNTIFERKDNLYFEYGRNQHFRFPKDSVDVSLPLAVREGDWKLFTDAVGSQVELFNLQQDPNETTDVSGLHPQKAKNLKNDVIRWFSKTDKSHIKSIQTNE